MQCLKALHEGRVLYRKVSCKVPGKSYTPLVQLVGSAMADGAGVYLMIDGVAQARQLPLDITQEDFTVRWNHALHGPTRHLLFQAAQLGMLKECVVTDTLFIPETKRVVLDEVRPLPLFLGMERKNA